MSGSDFAAGSQAGIFEVSLAVTDPGGLSGTATAMVVVYDPNGGFATGGGWIDSSTGAYKPDENLTGKAAFGFASIYQKGASVPTGDTAFKFALAGLEFPSESYKCLAVNQAATNAQYMGSGTVDAGPHPNGNPYKFMLWAGDGSPDTFRIKIWWENNGIQTVVYDNGFDQAIEC